MTEIERVYLYGSRNEGATLVPTKCAVCEKCWRIVGQAHCVHGGPYLGYVSEQDETVTVSAVAAGTALA